MSTAIIRLPYPWLTSSTKCNGSGGCWGGCEEGEGVAGRKRERGMGLDSQAGRQAVNLSPSGATSRAHLPFTSRICFAAYTQTYVCICIVCTLHINIYYPVVFLVSSQLLLPAYVPAKSLLYLGLACVIYFSLALRCSLALLAWFTGRCVCACECASECVNVRMISSSTTNIKCYHCSW